MAAKTIGVKLNDDLRARVMERCHSKSCNISAYLKNLIDMDLAWPVEEGKLRIKFEEGKIIVPCSRCGNPVPFKLR
jgi:hypothetical protein